MKTLHDRMWEAVVANSTTRISVRDRAIIKLCAAVAEDHFSLVLAHHLTEHSDPCQDRGVHWPCDVADAIAGRER